VRAVFDNADDVMTDGQTIRVSVEATAPEEFTVIPLAAIATDQTGRFVYVVNSEDIVEQRRLTLSVQRDGLVAVKEGLKPGERVIVKGQQRVKPGLKVNPQPMPVATDRTKDGAP